MNKYHLHCSNISHSIPSLWRGIYPRQLLYMSGHKFSYYMSQKLNQTSTKIYAILSFKDNICWISGLGWISSVNIKEKKSTLNVFYC